MFIDEAVVQFSSGRGGAGAASFHREKHVPRGGPNGADGGRGGDVVLIADRGKRTLYDFHLKTTFTAPSGSDASGNKSGKDGANVEIRVPVGTMIFDAASGELLADLAADEMRFVLCKGGRGGHGNLHYTSSVRQAPTIAQKGAPGEVVQARLELRLLADVGFVGLPNAGKSTLLSRISAARPKIADYPFTTLEPNLGVVVVDDDAFTAADLPGLIEGASAGKGLGHRFLRHVERTSVLVHVVDGFPIDGSDPADNFTLVENELKEYSELLYSRPRVVAINKADTASPEDAAAVTKSVSERAGDAPVLLISAVSGQGVQELLRLLVPMIAAAAAEAPDRIVTPTMERHADDSWDIERVEGGFRVVGRRVERLIAMTHTENFESLRHLHRQLGRIGVLNKLELMGAQNGDTVTIGDFEFEYEEDF